MIYNISNEDKNKRLDIFLKEKYPDFSRSFIQKQIKEGKIKVNEKLSSVHRFLKEGDNIEIEIEDIGKNKEPAFEQLKESLDSEIKKDFSFPKIIFENDDYLIINKQAGLIVHPGNLNEKQTLAHLLLKKFPGIEKVGEAPERPGIVHRLDKEVSGIMVIAKTQEMFIHLKKQFQERTAKKEYIALVYGSVKKPEGEIDFPIRRSKTDGAKMAARPLNQGGREAITEFAVIKNFVHWTLLSVKIKTGRTHQIRVHLNAYGHPVVGDNTYKPKKLKPTKKFGDRLFLHSWKLGFSDLKGEWKEFEAEFPEEFRKLM